MASKARPMITPDCAELFSFEERAIYLDHGGFGVAPRAVRSVAEAMRAQIEAAPRPFFDGEQRLRWRETAAVVAARFSASPDDVALVENATDGVNAVLRSLDFQAGDEILITSMTYGAVANAARHTAKSHGAVTVEARLPFPCADPQSCLDAVRAAITPRTRLAILDHVTSPTALALPIAEMVALCRAHRVRVLVDGAHAPGALPLDVPAVGADWYVGNLHKWYFAPRSCGFLWARPDGARTLAPAILSWDVARPFPHSFEWTGTRDPSAWLAIPAAFAFMDCFGEARVRGHNHALVLEGVDILAKAWGARLETPAVMIGAMALAPLPAAFAAPATEEGRALVQRRLWEVRRIACSCALFEGRLHVRISAQIYNAPEHYRELAQAVLNGL
jgi:isopenicillin-N epimerase